MDTRTNNQKMRHERKELAAQARILRKLCKLKNSKDAQPFIQSQLDGDIKIKIRGQHLAHTFLRGKLRRFCENTFDPAQQPKILVDYVATLVNYYWEGSNIDKLTQGSHLTFQNKRYLVEEWMNI